MSETGLNSPLLKVLHDLANWFDEQSVRGAIIGGVAASLRGRPRMTQDVDVVVWLGDQKVDSLLASGVSFGFEPRISDVLRFAEKNRVLLLVHSATLTPVDISLGGLPFEEEAITRASIVRVGGVSIPVAASEDLIIMKAVARRPRDMADIESMIDANPDLDTARIRQWAGEFATVLEMPEILADLELMLSRGK